ncbi:adenine nucleotide alpha hydrolase [Sulfitobacter brevis]|uniref:adenine nucleotide alpha hydrolase n=1 Tax=Sulfitobacter brevis TaxID=74348 RepID=UPI001FE8FE83|nr:adenine nucleotide alpha hydrolase [Sulfitobacter brevis]
MREILARHKRLAIAVSGGVDSLTLAHVAHDLIDVRILHAVSPAVPPVATARVADHGRRFGWDVRMIEAREFEDPQYLRNPANRCFFCKSNLYARISAFTDWQIASGANLDDLSDYRPGLVAAKDHGVVHPFVEAEISKKDLRQIASERGLADIAELPAQPCLASRISTGIPVTAEDLAFVDSVEAEVRGFSPSAEGVRCRILNDGVVLELAGVRQSEWEELGRIVGERASVSGRDFLGVRPYSRGSAFERSAEDSFLSSFATDSGV